MPREYYTLPITTNVSTISRELNRILDDISRRLNYLFDAGHDIDASDQKIINLQTGTIASDGIRFDQALLLSNLASVILGTTNQITVTDNGDDTVTISTPQNIDTDADVVFDTTTLDKLILNLTAALTPGEGEISWNADDGTMNVGLPGGNVILQVGEELLAPRSRAIGSNIGNGQLVYVSGATGSITEMTLAKADANLTSRGTIAMATEDVAQNQLGYYTAFGLVRDINTDPITYTAGDQLYLSAATAGNYTNIKPSLDNYIVKIGIVIRAHATEGIILVKIAQRSNHYAHIRFEIQRNTTTATIDQTAYQWNGDTDGGGFTYSLQAGVQGELHKIVNVGTSGNQLTITPDGLENLIGENSSFVLDDGESLIISYDTTDGWQ